MSAFDQGRSLETVRFAAMAGLLVACFLMGGASRVDVLSLVILQPLAVACIGVFLVFGSSIRWGSIRIPLLLLGALAAIMAIQLIPLPPELWMALPGHGQFAATAQAVGVGQPWRPISVTPDSTLDSIVSLSVPLAALIGFASLSPERTRSLLPYIMGGATLSAVVGLAQLAGGGRGPLYLYEITNFGSPVGLFANRNHQAVLLAMAWPMLAVWARQHGDTRLGQVRLFIAMAIGLFLVPMTLATGSRAGLALGIVGIGVAIFILRRSEWGFRRFNRRMALWAAGGLTVVIAVVGAAMIFSRDVALERASSTSLSDDVRFASLPTIERILSDFFPVGAGFGSFDSVFKVYEPLELLSPQYLNHAHNDLLELVLVGGLPAVIVLIAFLVWLIRSALRVWRAKHGGSSLAFARLALTMIVMLLLSSLVDYPLRTPLLAAIFAVSCGWLCDYLSNQRGQRSETGGERALPAGA